jgi:Tfp pilus assembly protein PilN
MRAVNLIPSDERRGDEAPLRTGHLVYVLTGGLVLLLLGIVAVALTSKQIDNRTAQKASLEQELDEVTAQAQTLSEFVNFRTVQESRASTISSLAQSRFDWSRVMHELALVLPSDISLSSLTGTVSPAVQLQSESSGSSSPGGGSSLRGEVAGPALEIVGCAPSQDAVAAFVASLEDIDGVTRVGVSSSKLPEVNSSGFTGEPGNEASTGSTSPDDCQSGPTIVKFEVVAAFDAVPTPSTDTTSPTVPTPAAPPSTGGDQQVADGQTQENVQRASVREQTAKAENAKTLIPGG